MEIRPIDTISTEDLIIELKNRCSHYAFVGFSTDDGNMDKVLWGFCGSKVVLYGLCEELRERLSEEFSGEL